MKRVADLVISILLLIIFLPFLLVIMFFVRVNLGAGVLFTQTRTGLDGKLFTLYKFRTMTNGNESDVDRLTAFGKFLRKTSIDELPQLWNVLRGHMSIVGPRPLLPEYLPLYSERQSRRHEVKPGMTGWSQVNGRNSPSWEDRLEMDVWYVENVSGIIDCQIMIKTPIIIFFGIGINSKGEATVRPFSGLSKKK